MTDSGVGHGENSPIKIIVIGVLIQGCFLVEIKDTSGKANALKWAEVRI